MNDLYKFDVIIIGAGVIGLAIARELSATYDNILLVEKERSFGQHTSSRNSEIIHSGLYYPKDTLKTDLCVSGNPILYSFLKRHNIPHKRCGKLIVAANVREHEVLESLLIRAKENGVEGLSLLDKGQIYEHEPEVKAHSALLVPQTGIVDSHSLMSKLEQLAKEKGVLFSYNTKISGIFRKNDFYHLTVNKEDVILTCDVVINSCGLWSDQIACITGMTKYRLFWNKGEYFKTTRYKNMNKLVYPVPDPEGKYLGIHTVMDLAGNISFGPNAYYIEELNYDLDNRHKRQFRESINRYLDIEMRDLSPAMSGIRPKLQAPSDNFKDFVIQNEHRVGYNNFVNLIGIESPGLTCCLSIAKYVKDLIRI